MPNLTLKGFTPSLQFAEIEAIAFWPERGEEEARKQYIRSSYRGLIVQMNECIFDQCNEPADEIGTSVKHVFNTTCIPFVNSIDGIYAILNAPRIEDIEYTISKRRESAMPIFASFLKIYLNDMGILNDPVATSMNKMFDLLANNSPLGQVYSKSSLMSNWVKFKDGIHIIAAISCWIEWIKRGKLGPRCISDEIDGTDIDVILGFAKTFLAWGLKSQALQAKSFLLEQSTVWTLPDGIQSHNPF